MLDLEKEHIESLRRNYKGFRLSARGNTLFGINHDDNSIQLFEYVFWDLVDPNDEDRAFLAVLDKLFRQLNETVR